MGCPQSKSKSRELSTVGGNDTNGHVARVRNDGVRPETRQTPTKGPVDYDINDPLVKSRADDFTPDVHIDNVPPTTTEKNNITQHDATLSNGITELPSVYEADSHDDITPELGSSLDGAPDNNGGDEGREPPVNVADIEIGQALTELEMPESTINVDGEESNQQHEPPQDRTLDTAAPTRSSYKETMQWLDQPDSSAVRYQKKGSSEFEYGLPEGIPKPAPPKARKSDLIKPNQFTVVDKLVEQTPDNAFNSVPKLGRYLSGEVKARELTQTAADDDGEGLPPPLPTTRKKKEIVGDLSMFKTVDEQAKNTPEAVRFSVQKLAAHLCHVATSDLERVRAFYVWICHNIRYMYDKDSVPDKLRHDALSTLRQGQGSSVGVLLALCKEVKIPAVFIMGCSKGLIHQADKEFSVAERNHSWNAVFIDGEWRFVDCTWGSGYIDGQGKFTQQFDEFWFLTDPEIFIFDHFPTHPIWQLLDTPVDIDEFNKKPSLTEKSREIGIRLISHREPIIYADNEVTISFGTETIPLSNITADLRNESGADMNKHRLMRRIDARTFEVRIVPAEVGQYSITLYGKSKDYRHAKYRKLTEYMLRFENVYSDPIMFPEHVKTWGPEPNFAELGFGESIQSMSVFKSDSNEFVLTLDQTKGVTISPELKAVVDLTTELKDYTMITATDKQKHVHVRFPHPGYYKLDIYAEGKLGKFECAAAFFLECTSSEKPDIYPKYNADSVSKYCCEIQEPRNREVPANSVVVFRLRSRDMKKVMVGVPVEESYGSRINRLGELTKKGQIFSGEIETPSAGETLFISGCSAPPNVFWIRMYDFVTV